MKLNQLSSEQREELAAVTDTNADSIRHLGKGRRGASAEMAIKLEKGAKKIGIPLLREDMCVGCGKCEFAKKARKESK
jgi:hypothetical protein